MVGEPLTYEQIRERDAAREVRAFSLRGRIQNVRWGSERPVSCPVQGSRPRRPWLLPVAVSILILSIAAYLVVRRAAEPEVDSRTVPVLAGIPRAGAQESYLVG